MIRKALNKSFAPEFINRLDEIVTFDQLDIASLEKSLTSSWRDSTSVSKVVATIFCSTRRLSVSWQKRATTYSSVPAR